MCSKLTLTSTDKVAAFSEGGNLTSGISRKTIQEMEKKRTFSVFLLPSIQ